VKKLLAILLAILMCASGCAFASGAVTAGEDDLHLDCMTIIVGKDISATGKVIVGHNEDDIGRYGVHHSYVPAAEWPEGTVLPAEEGKAAIPQADKTLGFYWSQVSGINRGASGADTFLNEAGVCIVSNNNAESKESIYNFFDTNLLTDGGMEYNLRRMVGERATSARHALELIIEMVETWGYAPSGRAYTVADSEEAFMIQILHGRRYIAARVPDNAVVCMPNHYTFHGLDDVEEMYYSEDLVSHAIEMFYYTPAVEGDYSDFDFAKVYQDEDSYMTAYNVNRQKFAMQILLDREWDVDAEGLPFAIYPEEKITLEDVIEVLSTHYEGTELDERYGPGAAPHDVGVRRICTGSTIEATVFEFSDHPLLTTAWTAFGRPCQLPFLPLHPLAGTVDAIDKVEDPAKALENHLTYQPGAADYVPSGWQTMRNFENLMEMQHSQTIEGVTALKEQYHAEAVAMNQQAVTMNKAILESGDTESAVQGLHQFDCLIAENTLSALTDHAHANFNIVDIAPCSDFVLTAPEVYAVTFTCTTGKPVESSLIFGLAGLNVRTKYASALEGTLTDLGGGVYSVSFDPIVMMGNIEYPGTFDFILGGNTEDGAAFAGYALIGFIK